MWCAQPRTHTQPSLPSVSLLLQTQKRALLLCLSEHQALRHFSFCVAPLARVCGEPAKNNRCGATPSMPLQTIPTCLGEHVVGKRKIESCGVTFRTRNVRSRLPDQHTFLAYRQVSVIKSFVSSAKFWCLKHLRPTCHAENRRLM